MLIHGNCQTHGGGSQQPGGILHTGLILLQLKTGELHKAQHQQHRNEHRIGNGGLQLAPTQQTDLEGCQGQEKGQIVQFQ